MGGPGSLFPVRAKTADPMILVQPARADPKSSHSGERHAALSNILTIHENWGARLPPIPSVLEENG